MTPPVSSPSPQEDADTIAALRAIIADQQGIIAAQQATIVEQQAQIAALSTRVAELERKLGLHSGNSGKPPSSDGLKKPPRTTSLREASGKAPGGQAGHPGKTLTRVAEPNSTVDHFPTACQGCGAALEPATTTGHVARQVFDLPEPQPLIVTEHRAHQCRCTTCGTQTRAAFPEGVTAPVQYGPRIAAIVVYLLHAQFLPERRLATLMADLFGVLISTATIANMSRNYAARFADFAVAVNNLVAAAAVKHLDETGFRVGGKTQWLHIASTLWLTFYRVSARRGSLPEAMAGIVVHDHWKPYFTLTGVLHALCNAHHLRELQALIGIEHEDWARRMRTLLRRACHAANLARQRGQPVPPRLIALIERCYDRIVADGLAFHAAQPALTHATIQAKRRGRKPRRVGENLLRRLDSRKSDVLRFLSNPDVPFTNNLAERDARMMKLRQKISGGFRDITGAEDFAIIRSLLSTARKQRWNLLQTLNTNAATLITRLQLA
jgi:transposase